MGRPLSEDQPRRHHYEFVHVVVRALALRAGSAMIELARRGELAESLLVTWKRVGAGLAPDDRLPADGLATSWHETETGPAALVTLPPAGHVGEAHLVAILADASGQVRFFALEHNGDADSGTVLTEWTADGRHLELGDGPRPDRAAFLAAVTRVLAIGC